MLKWKGQIKLTSKVILLSILIVGLFTACGEGRTKSDDITVYYVKSDRIVDIAINDFNKSSKITLNAVGFDSEQEMDDQFINNLNTRQQVPDVIVLNDKTTLDLSKIYQSTFLELDTLMDQDQSFNESFYIEAAMDGGKIDDEQIFLPVSFNLPVLFFDTDKVQSAGVTITPEADIDTLFSEIESHMDSISQNDKMSTLLNLYQKPILTLLFRAGSVEILNGKGEYVLEKEELNKLVDYAKIIYDEQEKAYRVAEMYGNDFSALASNALFLLWDNINLPYDVRAFDSLYQAGGMDNIDLMTIPAFKDGERAAIINLYGAIIKSTVNEGASFEFLKTLMDSYAVSTNEVVYTTPVSRSSYDEYLRHLKQKKNVAQSGRSPITIYPMSDAMEAKLQELVYDISVCIIPNTMIENILEESFGPYLAGSRTYDDCFADFERTLQIYLEE
ncbi:MAG: ABC transporter substrate-binding protein [Clostridia bacterium]|jgi:ABC-type glycerol-3-phosphate transport system substrate-binding protein|nr:ABC transporter substrate-binding protein [Clostridia bacterium]